MNKKIIIAIIIITLMVVISTAVALYIRLNYNKKTLSEGIATLTGRFELPEPTKACIAFLYTDDYHLGEVKVYPNFPEDIREQFKEQEGCALQEHFNGKNVKIKGKLKYVVCEELSQCYPGEFWAIEYVDSIEIIFPEQITKDMKGGEKETQFIETGEKYKSYESYLNSLDKNTKNSKIAIVAPFSDYDCQIYNQEFGCENHIWPLFSSIEEAVEAFGGTYEDISDETSRNNFLNQVISNLTAKENKEELFITPDAEGKIVYPYEIQAHKFYGPKGMEIEILVESEFHPVSWIIMNNGEILDAIYDYDDEYVNKNIHKVKLPYTGDYFFHIRAETDEIGKFKVVFGVTE